MQKHAFLKLQNFEKFAFTVILRVSLTKFLIYLNEKKLLKKCRYHVFNSWIASNLLMHLLV
jgi:hypothetical protein